MTLLAVLATAFCPGAFGSLLPGAIRACGEGAMINTYSETHSQQWTSSGSLCLARPRELGTEITP